MAVLEKTPALQDVDTILGNLSNETKQAVLIHLIGKRCSIWRPEACPFKSKSGEDLGYYVPPIDISERVRKIRASLTADEIKSIRQAIATPEATF